MKVKFTTNIDSEILRLLKIKAIDEGVSVNYLLEKIIEKERDLVYEVWKTNRFKEDILIELVAIFKNFEDARDFVEYESTICESYVILRDGKRIDID